MEVQLVSVEPGLLYFRCRGALHPPTGDSADPLLALLSNKSWEGNILLNLRDVSSVGTDSVAWLIHWHRWVAHSGGVLGLCCLPPQFANFFELCKLTLMMPVWDDEATARAALARLRAEKTTPLAGPSVPAFGPGAAVEPSARAARARAEKTAPPTTPHTPSPVTEADDEPEVENGVIPLPRPAFGTIPASPDTPATESRPAGKVVQVLVVDDSAVERRRAANALELGPSPSALANVRIEILNASNGREALAVIKEKRPQLVVTDLMMPELDGLGLVKEMRSTYPSIPVVLMTAHGSEEIAVAAMRAGAASYVPKKYLARDLGETVDAILRLAQADGEQLIFPHLTVSEFRFQLPTNLALISPLVDFLQGHLRRIKLCHEMDELRVAIALREALVNAMTHGNLEAPGPMRENDYQGYLRCVEERQRQSPYKDRCVHVTARETPFEAVYTILDEGPGFDPHSLPDPTTPDNFKLATGRGLYLIRSFMDEVLFNDAGNEITMVKRRSG